MLELTYILIVGMIVMGVLLIISYQKYSNARKDLNIMEEDIKQFKEDYRLKTAEYSNTILEYLRSFIVQVVSIKFRNFIDTHDLHKVTKATVSKLVEETAMYVKDSINENNIIFNDALFTKEFYEKYIIDNTMIATKELLEKSVIEIIDEGE